MCHSSARTKRDICMRFKLTYYVLIYVCDIFDPISFLK